jgi:NitT/TauT family transport system ATP-binding protein
VETHAATTDDHQAKIVVDQIQKVFSRSRTDVLRVFDSISFTIWDGQFVTIIGPSGCGKTTMLNLIAGLTQPTAGRVLVDSGVVNGPGRDRGVIFQQDAIFLWRTVRKNVEYGLEVQGLPARERRRRATEYLRLVGLEPFADFYPKHLSGGMKKRVAIAAVLANRPQVMLMDEPFGSLDYPTKVTLQEEVLRIWEKDRTTTLFVTHDIEEALYLSDRILVFVKGKLARDFEVPFPRPRGGHELRTSAEMQVLKDELWQYL